jgi:hypothetical protein
MRNYEFCEFANFNEEFDISFVCVNSQFFFFFDFFTFLAHGFNHFNLQIFNHSIFKF